MRRHPRRCDVDGETGRVVAELDRGAVECEVPSLFGKVISAEVRGAFIVAHTDRGKASFHATGELAGKMPWHAMVKALRELCLDDRVADRLELHITHHRFSSGARGRSGVAGRVLIDGEIVARGLEQPGPGEFAPRALGAALASYLHLTPALALVSDDALVQAFALLDRRLGDEEFSALAKPPPDAGLRYWFHRLRGSVATRGPG